MKNVIITGANGFIGSSLIKKLVENKIQVVAIDISFSNSRFPESELITCIETTIDSESSLITAIPQRDYDALYHFAWRGVNGAEKSDPTIQLTNINTAIICAKVAKNLNCKKFLVAGTIAEQAVHSLQHLSQTNAGMIYGTAKHCAHLMLETYCKNIGLEFLWMQFSNIYGVGNKTGNLVSYTLGEILKGHEAIFGPALQAYDFIYVDDLIEAVYRLGSYNTQNTFYYIGSGTSRPLKEYLYKIGELAGYSELIKIGVRPDDGIQYTKDMFCNKALVDDIGNYVSVQFDEGITKTINWLKSF